MVQRGFREAHGELELERRHASMVRRLSAFLADTSLAAGQADSLGETLRLVVEQARELLGANTCRGVLRLDDERHLSATSSGGASEAGWMNAREWADLPTVYDAAHTVSQRDEHVLRANLETLDGRPVGALIAESGGSAFTEADEAILTHLAQMASATIERAMSHRPPR
jgi:GAF domain-containing protein